MNTPTWYYVELFSHDVVFAERLTEESYMDTGNRGNLANDGGGIRLFRTSKMMLERGWRCGRRGYALWSCMGGL